MSNLLLKKEAKVMNLVLDQKTFKTMAKKNFGNYIDLNGQHIELEKNPTDFTLIRDTEIPDLDKSVTQNKISNNMFRLTSADEEDRDILMTELRETNVAHHIYKVKGTDEEIIIDDCIILKLRYQGTGELEAIIEEFNLVFEERIGEAYVLRLTDETGINPVKVANRIAQREGVAECAPEILMELEFHQQPALFPDQWHLTADLISNPDLISSADIQAPEAWDITKGNPDIVVAVIDDGFDLDHPALQDVTLNPNAKDYAEDDLDPESEGSDYHGTPVASIAVGSHVNGVMYGIAPSCQFLPIRIRFGLFAVPRNLLKVFQYVSQYADVVNCSFGMPPKDFDPINSEIRREITKLTETGGRRGKGLVMVFSAGNDDAPTFLEADKNVNGVKFTKGSEIREVEANKPVFSGFPLTEGVIVVSSMSSLKRKSGYSNWGKHITVSAPSNNSHYIMKFVPSGSDPRRDKFVANYRGLGLVAASNQPGSGRPFRRIRIIDDPRTPNLPENLYTKEFGGTSGAAPVVSGVVALMLAVNPDLTAAQVKQILKSTADRDLDPSLDLADDPNIQGLSGDFVGDRSLFFGSGKVNAFKAVRKARSLFTGVPIPPAPVPTPTPIPPSPPSSQEFLVTVRPNKSIPDNRSSGIESPIKIDGSGLLNHISVMVDITHQARGNLRVKLIAPNGRTVTLHRPSGSLANDLKRTYSSDDTAELENLIATGTQINGQWILKVSDNSRRNIGTLNSWTLKVKV